MKHSGTRYSSPVTPPQLRPHPTTDTGTAMPPVLCLHPAGFGRAAPRLVSFEWGRVSLSRSRR